MNQFLLYTILILDILIILTLIYKVSSSSKLSKLEKYKFAASCDKGEVFNQFGECVQRVEYN